MQKRVSEIIEFADRAEAMIAERDAEIERLQAEAALWSHRACKVKDQLREATAFIDCLAERIAGWDRGLGNINRCEVAAAECRAMAEKLRGET